MALVERLFEHCGEIFARRRGGTGSYSHELSWDDRCRVTMGGVLGAQSECHKDMASGGARRPKGNWHTPTAAARHGNRADETMVLVRCAIKKSGRSRLILHNGSTINRAPGLLGRLL